MKISSILENMPIKRKMVLLMMAILTVMLVLVSSVFLVRTIYAETESLKEQIATGAQVIAQMTVPSLLQNDRETATDELSALASAGLVRAACLYKGTGRGVFASYIAEGTPDVTCPPTLQKVEGSQIHGVERMGDEDTIFFYRTGKVLVFDRSVLYAGEEIGILRIYFNTAGLRKDIIEISLYIAGVLLVALGLTYLLTSYLQRIITQPILRLSLMARHYSDYDPNTHKTGVAEMDRKDEIGILFRSFYSMLERIARREKALRHAVSCAKEAQKEAERINNMKSLFLANISHELRTPLNGMIGMADLLMSTDMQEEQQKQVQMISEAGQTLLSIMSDILDFSKIEAGEITLTPCKTNIRKTVKNVLTQLSYMPERNNIELLLKIDPAVPVYIEVDKERLKQILANLIGNGIKFTEKGYVLLQIGLLSPINKKTNKAILFFSVEDTGPGIPAEKQDYIFEKFARIKEGAQAKQTGSGLGLAICRQLTRMMGGEIRLESTEGKGSVFSFALTVPAMELPEKEREKEGRAREIAKEHEVLLVSRKGKFREIICYYLRSFGVRYTIADTMQDVVKGMRDEGYIKRYDLVIIDSQIIKAPEYKAIRKLMKQNQAQTSDVLAHILFLGSVSAPDEDDVVMCRSVSLLKPFDDKDFLYFITRERGHDYLSGVSVKKAPVLQKRISGDFQQAILSGLSVLVADDDLISQKVIEKMLAQLGCKTVMVANGKEAVTSCEEQDFDVVLMDCMMPVMDGYEATRKIRENESKRTGRKRHKTLIIAMTANAMPGDKEKCLATGMDDYLVKPIRKQNVYDILKKNLKNIQRQAL